MKLTSPVALLVLLVVAGCGGGNDSFTEDYNDAVKPLSQLGANVGSSAGEFDRLAAKTKQTHDNLADLDPPDDAQDEMDKLLSGLEGVTQRPERGGRRGPGEGSGGAGRRGEAAGEVEHGGPAGRVGAPAAVDG